MQGEMKYRIKNNFCFRGEVLELSIENKEKICEISIHIAHADKNIEMFFNSNIL
jgi:hypothetical protein